MSLHLGGEEGSSDEAGDRSPHPSNAAKEPSLKMPLSAAASDDAHELCSIDLTVSISP